VDIIIAQRLVRKLCPHCRVEYEPDMAEKELIDWVMREIGMASMIRARKGGIQTVSVSWM
jgi:type II secretory ATPase GspE/PulE/Tfp pilus assembly ATPase PilB-like protein